MSIEKMEDKYTVSIAWGAWDGDSLMELSIPSRWHADVCTIADAPRLGAKKIRAAVQNSFSASSLRDLAREKQKIVVALEDITRPARLERVLQSLISEFKAAGVKKKHISFIVCNGAHAPMSRAEMVSKFGANIVRDFLVLNHNPYENLAETGVVLGKTPVRINRLFYEADLRIAVGSIIPHSFAGFSSGAKLVLPGLSDLATLERSHKYVMMGFRGGVNDVEANKFRLEIEEVVATIGLDCFIGVVPNSNREVAGVFAGNVVDAHRAGVNFARQVFSTNIRESYDVVVLNAYPKDSELLQADTALTALKTTKKEIVKEGGVLVVVSKCSRGLGHHSLFGPGMPLYRRPIKRRSLQGRDLILFTPNINQAEFQLLYWNGYRLANSWEAVISLLKKRFPGECSIAILPFAPLQLLQCPI